MFLFPVFPGMQMGWQSQCCVENLRFLSVSQLNSWFTAQVVKGFYEPCSPVIGYHRWDRGDIGPSLSFPPALFHRKAQCEDSLSLLTLVQNIFLIPPKNVSSFWKCSLCNIRACFASSGKCRPNIEIFFFKCVLLKMILCV